VSLGFVQQTKKANKKNIGVIFFKSFYSKINKKKDHIQYGLKKIVQYDFI